MRILQIINSLHVAGAERLIIETVPLMIDAGHEVDILLLNGKSTPFYEDLKASNICNVFELHKGFYNYIPYYNPLYIKKLRKYIKKDYNIIHTHLFPSNYYTVLANKTIKNKTNIVFTEHSTGNRRMDSFLFKWIDKLVYKSYSKVICITDGVKDNVIHKLNIDSKKLTVINNGINLRSIEMSEPTDRNSFGYNYNDIVIIMVAGFRHQKDHETLIKTVAELPEEYKLLLVGDGARREIIESLIMDLNIGDRVKLAGVRSDVYSLTKMADIAVVSSHWEGFGLVAAEAMACGTPLIASNVNGLAEVVGDGGILFETGNIEDLKKNILKLKDKEYYNKMTEQGIEQAKRFSIDVMVKNILNVYSELVNR